MNSYNERVKNDNFKTELKRKIYHFVLALIKLVDALSKGDPTNRVVSEQLIDSGTGILSNYIEAQVASSKKDFGNYLRYSLKCLNESRMWIVILRDSKKTGINNANILLLQLNEIGKILASILITLKNRGK